MFVLGVLLGVCVGEFLGGVTVGGCGEVGVVVAVVVQAGGGGGGGEER